MKRVYLGNKELTALGVGGGGDDTQKWVEYFNRTLTEFTVPEGVTSIYNYSFTRCTSLTSITLPDTLKTIGQYTFAGCSSLTGITLPDSVTSIERYTFNDCINLTSVVIPDSLTSIGTYSFKNCSSLTGITIPANVTIIGYKAFDGCSKLTTMTVKATTPPTLDGTALPSTIQTIYVPSASVDTYKAANGWKNYADKIQAIQIPAMKVTYVDNTEKTFYNLTSIEKDTDANKTKAKEVVIYDGVTSIGEDVFMDCTSLTGITIPNSVTNIGEYAFYACSSLTSVTIPNSVTIIGNYAFYNCSSLTGITIENSASKLGYGFGVFANIDSTAKLYVPSNLLPDYQADSKWTGAFKGGIYPIQ